MNDEEWILALCVSNSDISMPMGHGARQQLLSHWHCLHRLSKESYFASGSLSRRRRGASGCGFKLRVLPSHGWVLVLLYILCLKQY